MPIQACRARWLALVRAAAAPGPCFALDRLSIGIGMIPRGEVGLIFAKLRLGRTILGSAVVDATRLSTIVLRVMATTLVTPPLLEWSFRRARPGRLSDGGLYATICRSRTAGMTNSLILRGLGPSRRDFLAILADFA